VRFSLDQYDKAFESKLRLQIMSILMVHRQFDFIAFKELLDVTDGNLASHMRYLEKTGYVESHKQFVGRKPNTSYTVTPAGKKAFTKHLEALENLLKNNN